MRTERLFLAAVLALGPGAVLSWSQTDVQAEIRALKERLAALEKQAGGAAPAPAAQPSQAAGGSGIDFSVLVDSYYSLNFNHPASRSNQLRNFDTNANQFSLNMAKVTVSRPAEPLGFRLDLGLGPAFDVIHAAEPGGLGPLRYIQQAFLSYQAPVGKGLTVDVGKFVTGHGAEVIETLSNWNYSRSLLFAYAIPYYHFGLRASYPLHKTFTGTFHLVNGWNNVVDNNSGKTYGFAGAWTPNSHFSLTSTYMFGPEKTSLNRGWRRLSDTVATITVNQQVSLMFNYDYGVDRGAGAGGPAKARWTGVAGYARLAPNPWFAFIPRLEWYDDADGFTTGTAQKLKEATVTAEFRLKEGLVSRLEYRRDWSDQRFFDRSNSPASSRSQNTLLAGFAFLFAPKR